MNAPKTLFLAIGLLAGQALQAISPEDLQRQMEPKSRVPLTLIDVRSTEEFAAAHIPGAINVPAMVCEQRKLPPLGRVVIYDGGLGNDRVDMAERALRAKPGLNVEVLEGGFAGWLSAKGQTTAGRGLEFYADQTISYQQVKTNQTDDIVLVDLRGPAKGAKAAPAVDLGASFPQARVTQSPFQVSGKKKDSSGRSLPPLLVLVDRGDGAAQQMAASLKANGIRRYVILAGGEEIIAREGQPGMKRSSTLVTPPVTNQRSN